MRPYLLILLTVVPVIGRTQPESLAFRGYVKNLSGWTEAASEFSGSRGGQFLNSLQTRWNMRYYPSASWVVAADLRTRLMYQNDLNPGGAFTAMLKSGEDLLNLAVVVIDRNDLVLVSQIDRLYVDWTEGPVQLTLGRQRIAWGTNLVWNPTDVFNPFSVLDFDYEERPGIDAFRLQYYTGVTSRIELALAPGETSRERTATGLVRFNAWDFDFSLLGGGFQNGYIAGFSWAGQMWQGGFRGEARWTGNQQADDPASSIIVRRSYLTAALSVDYTFTNSLYIHTELLYNGDGVTADAGNRWLAAVSRGQLSPARWSIYQEFSGDLSALVRGSLFALLNPSDGSTIIVPSVAWSMATNWDLLLIALVPAGRARTEFGSYGSSLFARAKWSF